MPKFRIDAGTDIAMIGAWDASQSDPFTDTSPGAFSQALERDAAEGRLLLIHTGADGGGPIDLYVDDEIPPDVLQHAKAINGEIFVTVPSGRLLVGGAEDYRCASPRITGDDSVVTIAPGDYAVRCYVPTDGDDERERGSEAALKNLIGADNLRRYDQINLGMFALGMLMPVVALVVLSLVWNWKIGLAVAIVTFFSYWPIGAWIVQRTGTYRRFDKIISAHRLGDSPATFVLQLRRVTDRGALKCGSVRVV